MTGTHLVNKTQNNMCKMIEGNGIHIKWPLDAIRAPYTTQNDTHQHLFVHNCLFDVGAVKISEGYQHFIRHSLDQTIAQCTLKVCNSDWAIPPPGVGQIVA